MYWFSSLVLRLFVKAKRSGFQSDSVRLRQQTPLIIGITLLGVIGVLYAISSKILLDSFAKVEQQTTYQNVERVLDALSNDFNKLNATAGDYARWDDTYVFINDANDNYVKLNLDKATFTSFQLNVIALIHSSKRIVFGLGFDLKNEKQTPLPQSLRIHLATKAMLLQHPNAKSSHTGIVLLPEGPLMIASRPILTGEGKGPIRGTLLMGSYFNAAQIKQLAELTRVSLTVYQFDDARLPSDFQIARSSLSHKQDIFVQPLNTDVIAGYALLKDIYGNPGLLLRVATPRVIYNQSLASLRYLKLSLLFLGLVFGVVVWRLLKQLVCYIAERDSVQQILFQEKELAQVTLHSIGDAVITTNAEGRIESLNLVAEKLTGWRTQEARGLPLTEVFRIFDEKTFEPVENLVEKALHSGHRIVDHTSRNILIAYCGDEFSIDESVAPIRTSDGQIVGAVLVFRDVTQTREMARELSRHASYDALTGLMNRREFEHRLEQTVVRAKAENQEHSLCFLDLDRFKPINDTCGHAAGDELLRQLSTLLQSKVRMTDTVARLGGDEFGILFYQCPPAEALHLAQTLCESVKEFQFVWQDKVFTVGVSVGLVAITAESPSLSSVLSSADAACYAAKNKGRGRVHVYQADDWELAQQHREMQWSVRINQALEDNRFCLYYQTIAPLKTSNPGGKHYEVLLRLVDEQGELVLPGAFIPAAERYNLMPTIDRWVIRTLFASQGEQYQKAWDLCQTEGGQCLYTINLSGASINDDQFVDFVREQFTRYQIPPQVICFEITETVAIANLSKAVEFIQELKMLGCRFALDDFGSGMSSFAYLKNLPVDYLKIDGDFVKDIIHNPTSLAMVQAMNRIGYTMNIQTIAEFVENDAILEQVAALGVDYAQGYGIAKPRPLL